MSKLQVKYKINNVEPKWRIFNNDTEYNNFCDYYDEQGLNVLTILDVIILNF
jgi:hypothetical protein